MADWRTMDSAPKDGSIIEIESRAGYPAFRGLYRCNDDPDWEWTDVRNPSMGMVFGAYRWRPFFGTAADIADYRDPYSGFDAFSYFRGKRPVLRLFTAEVTRWLRHRRAPSTLR